MRKYRNINPSIFTSLSCKYAIYILGFLWADGHIQGGGRYVLSTTILKEDADVLKPIFYQTGKWNARDIKYKNHPTWRPNTVLSCYSKEIYLFLLNRNYSDKHLGADQIISEIPPELRHYWYRGIFDGDGCFYYNKKNHTREASITSSYDQDWNFVLNICRDIKIRRPEVTVRRTSRNFSRIRFTNKSDIIKFGNYIYKDYDQVGLSRKYHKWLELIV